MNINQLSVEICREIIWEDSDDYEVIERNIVSNYRWTSYNEIIVKELATGNYFRTYYSQGLTERQDTRPFEDEKPSWKQVYPVEKTIIVYE